MCICTRTRIRMHSCAWAGWYLLHLLHREEYEKALDSNKSVDYTDLISMAGGFSRRCIRS